MTKNQIAALSITCALTLAATFLAFHVTPGQATEKFAAGGRLEGTWDTRVSIINCATGAVIRSFDSVGSFNKGGTMIDSTSGMPQSLKTPGQGVWAHTTDSNYVFRFKSFSFDAAGNYTGYTIIQHEAQLDPGGDSYSSSGTAEIYAPNGTQVAAGCSSTVATRFGI